MIQKLIEELEAKKSYDKPMSFMSGINQAIDIIKSNEPAFEESIKKAFLAAKLELSDYKSAQDYYNQNYKNE